MKHNNTLEELKDRVRKDKLVTRNKNSTLPRKNYSKIPKYSWIKQNVKNTPKTEKKKKKKGIYTYAQAETSGST